jgi:hypothetical protein
VRNPAFTLYLSAVFSASTALPALILVCFMTASGIAVCQSTAAGPLVRAKTLPKAVVREPYRFQLQAEGGTPPFRWTVVKGSIPHGMQLDPSGMLKGTPGSAAKFPFTVTVTDSGKPARQRDQELVLPVVEPLTVVWATPPTIHGHRIAGTIKVSNETGQDFDLTAIVLAVAENGRATAVGYQRFTLRRETVDLEIPFAENLPHGAYELAADVVAEVETTGKIFRVRLGIPQRMRVEAVP